MAPPGQLNKIIKKLENLKRYCENYNAVHYKSLGSIENSEKWKRKVLPYIRHIELDLIEIIDFISAHTEKWSRDGIREAIWSVDDLDFMDELLQEIKQIQKKIDDQIRNP